MEFPSFDKAGKAGGMLQQSESVSHEGQELLHARFDRAWLVVPFLLLLAMLAIPVDLSLARYLQGIKRWGEFGKLVDLSESFSHGLAVAVLLILVVVLDSRGRKRVWRIASGAYGGGLLANLVKALLIARQRPAMALEREASTAFATFGSWLPAISLSRENWRSPWQSFPSAHTATAWGLAVVLAYFYPRGRFLFVFLACLASFQRMKSQSHFLSDVLAGAAVGCLAGLLVTRWEPANRWFARRESKELPAG